MPLADDGVREEASRMNELLIGYARVSTQEQDLSAQRIALERLGVDSAYIITDHGLTGTNRARPGLREALAVCRDGDTLVVAKLDRPARSLRDAKDIVDELTAKHVKLSIGGSVHDPVDPVGRLLFNVHAIVAEFDLIEVHNAGTHTTAELAELFNVARSTVYRTIQRQTPSENRS
jgi:DNA invertase Pin-like site-specific DNA recombinase